MIDLHLHSTASDGTWRPAEIVRAAEAAGLSAVALTDHDTVAGLPEFIEAGRNSSVQTVPGIELSSSWYGSSLHFVGLFIDPGAPALQALMRQMVEGRHRRNEKILAALKRLGYPVEMDEVVLESGGEVVGRPHIASVLVRQGRFSQVKEVFDALLGHGKPAYVRRFLPKPEEVIATIHLSGGAAVWAHPLAVADSNRAQMRRRLKTLVPAGLDGAEAYYGDYSAEQEQTALELLRETGLLASGGSDCHGSRTPAIRIGTGNGRLQVADELLEPLRQRAREHQARRQS